MLNQFSRTEILFGKEAMKKLELATGCSLWYRRSWRLYGGGSCQKRSGQFVLVDDDKVCLTNLNRQIIATRKTIGQYKVDVMKERILDINPKANVTVHRCFFLPENSDQFDFASYSYIVDAIDTVTAKIELVMKAKEFGVPIISAMGAGNKIDPTQLKVADIYKTSVCPLQGS